MDRRQRFLDGLPRPWPLPYPQIVDAVDGSTVTSPTSWRGHGRGEYGCLVSHLRVLDEAIADHVHSLLVLEDDALFVDDFAIGVKTFARRVPQDWGLLMLGGQHISPPCVLGVGVVRCVNTQRTHAYVVRGSAMEVLAKVWHECVGPLDHQLPKVQALVTTYAPAPFLVAQAAGLSDVSLREEPARHW